MSFYLLYSGTMLITEDPELKDERKGLTSVNDPSVRQWFQFVLFST